MVINTFLSLIHSNLCILFVTGTSVVLSIYIVIHILLHKDDVKSSIGWIAFVLSSHSFFSIILYIFLGINRVKRKGTRLRGPAVVFKNSSLATSDILKTIPTHYKQFVAFGHKVYPQDFTLGNSVQPLQNGIEAYPEMIKAIKNANKEILISSYIFDYDNETNKFLEAIKMAIKNGAVVKILVDGIGILKFFHNSIERKFSKIKGLEYGVFLPPQIPIAMPFVNLRNHRKMMVIDGETAFFGGMNLSKNNVLVNDIKKGVLDITFKLNGPIISQISKVFEDDWEFVTGKKFQSVFKKSYFVNSGAIPARIIPDGPDNKNGIIEFIIHGAINIATKKIIIATPYFLPENNILTALEMAAMRGVDVEIVIPNKSDHRFINWAATSNFLRLVESGVRIYRTPPPFDHSKIFIVDYEWIFLGSANWDVRSFKLHFESNIEIFSKSLAKKLCMIIESKKQKAKITTISECKNMSFLKHIRNNAFRLLTPYG